MTEASRVSPTSSCWISAHGWIIIKRNITEGSSKRTSILQFKYHNVTNKLCINSSKNAGSFHNRCCAVCFLFIKSIKQTGCRVHFSLNSFWGKCILMNNCENAANLTSLRVHKCRSRHFHQLNRNMSTEHVNLVKINKNSVYYTCILWRKAFLKCLRHTQAL